MINQAQEFLSNGVIIVALIVYAILGLLTDGRSACWKGGPWHGAAAFLVTAR